MTQSYTKISDISAILTAQKLSLLAPELLIRDEINILLNTAHNEILEQVRNILKNQ